MRIPRFLRAVCLVVLFAVGGCGSGSGQENRTPVVEPPQDPDPSQLSEAVKTPRLPKRVRPLLRGQTIATGDPELDPLVALLNAKLASESKEGGRLIIEGMTDVEFLHFPEPYQRLVDGLTAASSNQIPADMIRDFCEKNRQPREVWPEVTRYVPSSLISLEASRAFFTGKLVDGWKRFYSEYPNACAIVTVSRVGLNRDKTRAMIYMGETRGPLNGAGRIYLLKKEGDAWVELPVSIGPEWVS